MKLKFMLPLLLFFTAVIVQPQSRKIDFTEYDLPNGLHVILHKDNSTPIVATTVTYHVGSKNEDADRTGFAHFFEHLMFEGTENIGRGEFDNIVQNAGGQLNAYTSFDETLYYLLLPSNQLELGLWLESDRMFHAKIDTVGVETQRSVVKEERKQSIDNRPYGSFWEKTFGLAYTEHPYMWTPIGSAQYIDEATIDEFRDFYKTYYVPNNAVLCVAGDIDIDQTKKLIDKYFSEIPKGKKEIKRPKTVEPKQTTERRETVLDNIQLPAVIQAYHIPAQGTDDYYALNLLTNLLSAGESSRLNKALVDDKRVAINVGSFPVSLEHPGLFIALAIANFGKTAEECEKAMDEEINKVRTELVSEDEFAKIKNQVESEFVMDKNRIAGIAMSLSKYYLFFNNTDLINTELEKYAKVTREDLKRVANEYLVPENRSVLYYLPKQAK